MAAERRPLGWRAPCLGLALVASVASCGAASPTQPQGNPTASYVTLPLQGCTTADYTASLTVGDTTMRLVLDSGSTTLAVASTSCLDCATQATYDVNHGTQLNTRVSGSYGDGSSWAGGLVRDTVALQKASSNGNAAMGVQQNFAAVAEQNNFFRPGICSAASSTIQAPYDGLLGLGPDALLQKGSTSFLTLLAQSNQFGSDMFALQICGVGGNVTFGGYDTALFAGTPTYVPLLTAGALASYYSLQMADVQLGQQSLGLSAAELGAAVVDNGTSYLALPPALYTAFVRAVAADANFTAAFSNNFLQQGSCAQSATFASRAELDAALPKLTFVFVAQNGNEVALSVSASHSYLVPVTTQAGALAYCPSVTESLNGGPLLLGNAVMRAHVVVFDRQNRRLGFAPSVGCNDASLPLLSP